MTLPALTAGAVAAPAAQPPAPLDAEILRDVPYVTGGHERQKLDLYLPGKKSGRPLPLIVWVHGGSWSGGDKGRCLPAASRFTARGYAIASIGYRLSGTAVFPAQLEDCKAAVRWLRAHAASLHIDPDRIAAWGSSAGGHLAALLGTTGDTRAFDTGENLDFSSGVQAVVDYYGPADFCDRSLLKDNPALGDPGSPVSLLIGATARDNPEKVAAASPVSYVTKGDAPFFIVHGTDDPAVPVSQSRRLDAALWAAGVFSKLKVIEGAAHGGPEYTTGELLDEVDAFLRVRLRSIPRKN
ncbi:MAG: alpha/beta hydrolase [Opitutaceae bacterium]|nr:alpha/beta hydrolase [Opitutaceae bacterium]